MVVIIPHSTQELKLIHLQKQLISKINDENNIWYRQVPLLIEIPDFDFSNKQEIKDFSKNIETVSLGKLTFSENNSQIFIPVSINTKNGSISSTLPLLHCLQENQKLPIDKQVLSLQEVFDSLKIFQLSIATKNCQLLHNSGTTVQSCKTCSYIFQDSVWFKKS